MPLFPRLLPFAIMLLPTLAMAQGAPMSLTPQPGSATPKAAAPQAATPAPAETPQQTVQRINAYLNKLVSFTSRFVQIGADGRRFEGNLYVQRPGRLRFEYDAPSPLEIVADGTSVVIRDRKLATQDLYAIGQTPLKFLLADRIDITKDAKLLRISHEPRDNTVTAVLEDKSTFGGTSRIRLTFEDAEIALKRWVITDPQGFDTQVALSDIDTGKKLPAKLFTIDYSRAPERQDNR